MNNIIKPRLNETQKNKAGWPSWAWLSSAPACFLIYFGSRDKIIIYLTITIFSNLTGSPWQQAETRSAAVSAAGGGPAGKTPRPPRLCCWFYLMFKLKISRGDYNYSTPLINRMIFHDLWLSLSHTHTCANTHTHTNTHNTHTYVHAAHDKTKQNTTNKTWSSVSNSS